METRELSKKLDELQRLIDNLRSTIESEKKAVSNLEEDEARFKQMLADKASEATIKNPNINFPREAIQKTKHDYQRKKENSINEAKNKRRNISQLERHLSEAESVYNELKKEEGAMRELEQKAKTWLDKANKITS